MDSRIKAGSEIAAWVFRIILSAMKIFSALLFLFLTATASAAPPDSLKHGGQGVVAAVIDGDTVRLKDGAADIRLIGLQAPKLPLGRRGFKAWPLADEAKAALTDLVLDKSVTVRLGTGEQDRNGRILAHLVREDGLWVQGEMLKRGWARVYTFPDNRALAADMLALEAEARAAQRGIWGHPFYAVRDAAGVPPEETGTFQIVAGTVQDTAQVRERIYLNFGADFRTDFTVSIDKKYWAVFSDPLALKGRRIEARGWLTSRNGPMIEATHPEQIAVR
jgi:endonuclease YncB( thermonuclease family)